MASPSEIFFRYLDISAELSAVEAEILTRGKEPVEESSAISKRGNVKIKLEMIRLITIMIWDDISYHLCPQQWCLRSLSLQAE